MINIAENIRKDDDENISFGIFVELKKAFDTADHQMLLAKLNHFGVCGILNAWFKSFV